MKVVAEKWILVSIQIADYRFGGKTVETRNVSLDSSSERTIPDGS